MKKFDIVSFGEILIDFTNIGQNEFGQKLFAQNAGGAPANVLVCASKLGGKTAFLGKVGNDMHGHFLKQTLDAENVNTDGVILDDNYFTTLAFVDIDENGERSFSFARKHGADIYMTKNEMNTDILENTKIFHVGSLSLTTDLGFDATVYAIKSAKHAGATISYDPNYRASLWHNVETAKAKMRSIVKYIDIMKISDEECELLTGEADALNAANQLINQGVKVVCVTLGKQGALVVTKENSQVVKGYKEEKVVDTTGAGDSFFGAFLSRIAMNNGSDIEFEQYVGFADFANATATLCVQQSGAMRAMPTLAQVEALILH